MSDKKLKTPKDLQTWCEDKEQEQDQEKEQDQDFETLPPPLPLERKSNNDPPLYSVQKLCIAACVYARQNGGLPHEQVDTLFDLDSRAVQKGVFDILRWHHESPEPSLADLLALSDDSIFEEAKLQSAISQILKTPCCAVDKATMNLITECKDNTIIMCPDDFCLYTFQKNSWHKIN